MSEPARVARKTRSTHTHEITLTVGIVLLLGVFVVGLASTQWATLNGVRVSCGVTAWHLVPSDPGPAPHLLFDACERSHIRDGSALAGVAVAALAFMAVGSAGMKRRPPKQWSAPPGWPQPPHGWQPPFGWEPPTSWPTPPDNWQWWQRAAADVRQGAK